MGLQNAFVMNRLNPTANPAEPKLDKAMMPRTKAQGEHLSPHLNWVRSIDGFLLLASRL